eukprot:scaffold26091_cov62-Phaeocystis_antarctica.AAC.2
MGVGGVERGARAVQPLGDVEVTAGAGLVQRRLPTAVGGADRGTRAVQPLGDAEVPLLAGDMKCLHTTTILRPHARAARHRCLRCRQITCPHGSYQPCVEQLPVCRFVRARAGCGGRHVSTRRLCTCKAGVDSVVGQWKQLHRCSGAEGGGPWACARRTRQASVLRSACWSSWAVRSGRCKSCTGVSPPFVLRSIVVGGVDRGAHAVQPLSDAEVTHVAGPVQWCLPVAVGGVDGGTRTVQQLSDVEVALEAGEVQWCISIAVDGVERGTLAAQPLGDVEVALPAGEVKWLLAIMLRPHARAVRHRCLRCR